MDFVEITIDNIIIGAQVVSKQVYREFGINKCAIGIIEEATLHFGEHELFIELEIRWLTGLRDRTFTYRADMFYMIVPDNGSNILSRKNPNKTFIKEV